MQNNKVGIITSFSVQQIHRELITGSVDFLASDIGAMNEFFQQMRGEIGRGVAYKKEFMCLYCGSPNTVEHTHCKKCGAPRSFVIG